MIGTSTTVIAPVGPLTWTRLPPNTAARAPATIAVISPAPAPIPELTPKPRASGSATRPDHQARRQVPPWSRVHPVRALREQRGRS